MTMRITPRRIAAAVCVVAIGVLSTPALAGAQAHGDEHDATTSSTVSTSSSTTTTTIDDEEEYEEEEEEQEATTTTATTAAPKPAEAPKPVKAQATYTG